MLNYTTTTIVNSASSVYANATDKLFRVKYGPELYNDGTIHKAVLVSKQPYAAAIKATATVNVPSADGIYRIAMYIRLRNNNNPYFSNDWTFKGKPLYIEFTGGDSAATIVTRAKKYMLAQYGYNLVEFENSAKYTAAQAAAYNATLDGAVAEGDSNGQGGTYTAAQAATHNASLTGAVDTDDVNPSALTIVAHDQWEMFMDQDNNTGVWVEKLQTVDMAGNIVVGTANSPTHEEFVKDNSITATVDNGNEAFGDFAHIVKDLRLPTAANRRWQGIAEGDVFGDEPNDDKPLPTGHYTQYTIQYTSERGVLQQTALGGVATSRTVHVFYVESAATSAFETALSNADIADGTAVSNAATAATGENVTGTGLI